MVGQPAAGETVAEIAERYGVDITTVRNKWTPHPDWPASVGKRGRWPVYDPAEVDRWHTTRSARQSPTLQPERLYTAAEIEAATGITAATIRSAQSRGFWPQPAGKSGRANAWTGAAINEVLQTRRAYHRHDPS